MLLTAEIDKQHFSKMFESCLENIGCKGAKLDISGISFKVLRSSFTDYVNLTLVSFVAARAGATQPSPDSGPSGCEGG